MLDAIEYKMAILKYHTYMPELHLPPPYLNYITFPRIKTVHAKLYHLTKSVATDTNTMVLSPFYDSTYKNKSNL